MFGVGHVEHSRFDQIAAARSICRIKSCTGVRAEMADPHFADYIIAVRRSRGVPENWSGVAGSK